MNKRSNAFAPMDTGSPPPMDFTFTNAGQSRGTPAHRDYFSDNQADRSKYIQKLEESDELVSPNSPTPYGQMPPKKLKPGPISRSDLSSSSTNVFKLRAESAPSAQKPATSARLRQEVFKKPHTLAPSFSNLDTATAARFAPSPGLSTGGDAMLKVSNRQMKHVYADSSGASPAPSPFLKSGAEAISDAIRTPGRINTGQRRKSSVHGKSSSLLLSAVEPTPRAPDVVQPEDYLPRATEFPPALVDLPRTETRYQTPARDGAIPTTPSSGKSIREDTGSMHDLRRKCEIYEVDQKFDRDAIASQRQVIEELSSENARIELKTRDLESKYAAEVKEIAQRFDHSHVEFKTPPPPMADKPKDKPSDPPGPAPYANLPKPGTYLIASRAVTANCIEVHPRNEGRAMCSPIEKDSPKRQLWYIQRFGKGYKIKNAMHNVYLSALNSKEGTVVETSPQPTMWNLMRTHDGFAIQYGGEDNVVDLHYGRPEWGSALYMIALDKWSARRWNFVHKSDDVGGEIVETVEDQIDRLNNRIALKDAELAAKDRQIAEQLREIQTLRRDYSGGSSAPNVDSTGNNQR
ncbi:unnamed protein product [Rhizoctonia solani]|uniref:Uncharacterized protein n=1 Tax=Rhizoctonia solani TaxID=456999 RepID=A0A8H3DS45_9AGAM|nr:unnamed protein product [Rhizoctonia solani]